jgi:Sulfotransferase family
VLYYLHIPKTAGTSVRDLFGQVYGKNLVEVYGRMSPAYAESLKPSCHKDSVLFGHYSFGIHRHFGDENPRYMTILRNPIERVISWYKGHVRDPGAEHYERIRRDRLTLAEFIKLGITPELNNHSVRVLTGRGRGRIWKMKRRAQNYYTSRLLGKQIYQVNGKRYLDRAIANLNRYFCFVGIVEKLEQLTQFLAGQGTVAAGSVSVPRLNVAPPMEPTIDSQTLDAIRKANELDLILYEQVAAKLNRGEPWHPVERRVRHLAWSMRGSA